MSLNPVPTRRKSTLRDFYREGRRSLIQAWRPVRNPIPVLTPNPKAEIHVVREGALWGCFDGHGGAVPGSKSLIRNVVSPFTPISPT